MMKKHSSFSILLAVYRCYQTKVRKEQSQKKVFLFSKKQCRYLIRRILRGGYCRKKELFHFYENPNLDSPIGANLQIVLGVILI